MVHLAIEARSSGVSIAVACETAEPFSGFGALVASQPLVSALA